MRRAFNRHNAELRRGDVWAVLDALAAWNRDEALPFVGRLDLSRVGMSGHSFGARTTQSVSGQRPRPDAPNDERLKAAVVMSPSAPRGIERGVAFGAVELPWLLMTGTNDVTKIGGADMASRLAVYPALPPGGKYELVLDGAEHSVFADPLSRKRPSRKRNPNHPRVILALSTAFWDAYLREDAAALAWLDGDGPRGVMEAGDRWQFK